MVTIAKKTFFRVTNTLLVMACYIGFTSTNAFALNCEALAEMKPSDSVNVSPEVIESCIMNGFDPPKAWRELGGLGRGVGSASGAITPANKCRGDGKCQSYSTEVTAYYDHTTTAPVDCSAFSGPSLPKSIATALGLEWVDCNQCINNFIQTLPAALTSRKITVPCVGGAWQQADQIGTDCTAAQPNKFVPMPAGGLADDGKGLTCGGSVKLGPQKTSLVTDAMYVAQTFERNPAAALRTDRFNNIKIFKRRDVVIAPPPPPPAPLIRKYHGDYDHFQDIVFDFSAYIFPRVLYDLTERDNAEPGDYHRLGVEPAVVFCNRPLGIPSYNSAPAMPDHAGPIAMSVGDMDADIARIAAGCTVTSAPDNIEIFDRGKAPSCRTTVDGSIGGPKTFTGGAVPPRPFSDARWETYTCGVRPVSTCYRSMIPPHNATAADHPNHPGPLPDGYWDYEKCLPTAKKLEIEKELISIDGASPIFAVRFKNSPYYAFFEYDAGLRQFVYKLMAPQHESGLNEPQIVMNGVRITYPVEDNTCTFSHLPAPVPCAGYNLSVNRDQRLLILPPDRKTYEAPNASGKLVPTAPQKEQPNEAGHNHTLFDDPAIYYALNGDVNNLKLLAAPNPEETVAMFPEDTKLEVFGDAQILLMDGGIVVRDDGEHITVPPASMLEYRKRGGNLELSLSESNVGTATIAGEDHYDPNDPANASYNVTNSLITYNPRPYHPDNYLNERGMQQKYVENPLYPDYPAVVFPRGAVKFLSGDPAAVFTDRNLDLVFPVTWKEGAAAVDGEIVLPNGEPYVVAALEIAPTPCRNDLATSTGDAPNQHCAMYVYFQNDVLRYPNGRTVARADGGYRLPFNGNMSETYELAANRTGCPSTVDGSLCPTPPTVCKASTEVPPRPCYFTQSWDNQTAAPTKVGRKAYALAKNSILHRDLSGMVYTGTGVKVRYGMSDTNQYDQPLRGDPNYRHTVPSSNVIIWRADFYPVSAPPPAAINDNSVQCNPGTGRITPPAGYGGRTGDVYSSVDGQPIECRSGNDTPATPACTAPGVPAGCEWKSLPICTTIAAVPCVSTSPDRPAGCTFDLPRGCQRPDNPPAPPVGLPPICDAAGLPAGCRTM